MTQARRLSRASRIDAWVSTVSVCGGSPARYARSALFPPSFETKIA
jgi:hypothetical protein